MDPKAKGKSINGLMRHLRQQMEIGGSEHKRLLTNYGYYHGYKGYRFFKTSSNTINYTTFDELISVINYDNDLKALLYSPLMFIETALKNIIIDEIVDKSGNIYFESIYENLMFDNTKDKRLKSRRLKLRDRIYQTLSNSYNRHSMIVTHFYNRGFEVPIWAIFEELMLNDVAEFVACINKENRVSLHSKLNMVLQNDPQNLILSNTILVIKDLRNAVAHNQVIFDVRFKRKITDPKKDYYELVRNWVKKETNIKIFFESISDYVILICCILKNIGYNEDRLSMLVSDFEGLIDQAYEELPRDIYNKITSTNVRYKIKAIRSYVNK